MNNILIGSRAIAYWNPKFKVKDTKDWDVIGVGEPQEGVEWHSPDLLNNYSVGEYFGSGCFLGNWEVCSPLGLRLIYRSHLWRDHKFDQHITKYHKYLLPVASGYMPDYIEMEWYKERVRLTKKEFPQGNPSLNQSNADFFDDALTGDKTPEERYLEHDALHELFAYGDRPMFERLKYAAKKDQAKCEKALWDNLEWWEKDQCVAEETYVIATERFLIPTSWGEPTKLAYMKALKKVCTTLTSGWFRYWAIDNYPRIVLLYDQHKFESVKELTNGKD